MERSKADEAGTGDEHKTDGDKRGGAKTRKEREGPSPTMLEKGVIYFFFRARVNVDEAKDVGDIARSFMVLRPLAGERLGPGAMGDAGNGRLIMVPKKVFPQTGRERWMAVVEKTHASLETLKEQFLASNDYATKTAGTRHAPAATPVGEGVYAITAVGRDSHLAYVLTRPEKLDEVQREMGLKERGSFVISTRNPTYPPPPNAGIPDGPEYPKEWVLSPLFPSCFPVFPVLIARFPEP